MVWWLLFSLNRRTRLPDGRIVPKERKFLVGPYDSDSEAVDQVRKKFKQGKVLKVVDLPTTNETEATRMMKADSFTTENLNHAS